MSCFTKVSYTQATPRLTQSLLVPYFFTQKACVGTKDLKQTTMKDASTQTDPEHLTEPAKSDHESTNEDAPQEYDSTSSGSWTDTYVDDPDYTGSPYHSQPCFTGKYGASYTPPGWKRITVKRKRLNADNSNTYSSEDVQVADDGSSNSDSDN